MPVPEGRALAWALPNGGGRGARRGYDVERGDGNLPWGVYEGDLMNALGDSGRH